MYTTHTNQTECDDDVVSTHSSRSAAKAAARSAMFARIYLNGVEIARVIRGRYLPAHVALSRLENDFLAGEQWVPARNVRAEKYMGL